VLRDLQGYADSIVEQRGTPALSLAVWHEGKTHCVASGILNVDTGVAATVDALFQIGSVTKSFTASLVMLLAEEGRIDLDRPIKHYLADFHVLDPEATQTITARHLLSHTSGLESDASFHQDDTDEYVNPIARYVDRCFLLPQVHRRIGAAFSYSNAGYVIAGRLIEVIAGLSWRKAVEDRIFKPLNMNHAFADRGQALRYRVAIGHLLSGSDAQTTPSVVSVPYLPSGMAPTGSVLTMSACALLKFGKAHLSGGQAESGTRWMSEAFTRLMQRAHVDLPAPCLISESKWGLGWALSECHGVRMFGHSGG
jgi:CubicO group peptidase (beta-lactamase class C family)